jgi:hypothetical protein
MPTLVIDNVPVSLYERIEHLAKTRRRTPADTVLDVLETAFRSTTPTFSEAPLPPQPLLTEEICAPCSIPRPEGKPARAVRVAAPLPQEPFLTEEICAPFDIPWPEGESVVPIEIAEYVPEPHDIPDAE